VSLLRAIKEYLLTAVFGLGLCLTGVGHHGAAEAADWPQWRGPNRDGKSSETGLLKKWPEGDPKLLWEITGLGKGYSSLAVADGKLYTMGDVRLGSEKVQYVLAYDLSTRKRLWAAKVGPTHSDGPRCTPTIDDSFVYAIGTAGRTPSSSTATSISAMLTF
jgi:hypothetical protein